MTTPQRIPDDVRARIVELARDGWTRNAIAQELHVGAASVTRYVHAAGLSFDREGTKAATGARQADNAAKREKLASALMADIDKARRGVMREKPEDMRGHEQRSRSLAALSRSFADITRAAPVDVPDESIANVGTALLAMVEAAKNVTRGLDSPPTETSPGGDPTD